MESSSAPKAGDYNCGWSEAELGGKWIPSNNTSHTANFSVRLEKSVPKTRFCLRGRLETGLPARS